MNKDKCLVVGATGGIGRSTVKALVENENHVRILVRSKQKAEKYFFGMKNVEIFEGDATKPVDLSKAIKGCSTLFYCANTLYTEWIEKARPLLKLSLDAALDAKARFVFPGNVYIYGHAQYNPVDEKHPHAAHTVKGKIRVEMEEMIKKYSSEKGLQFTIVRFPDFYGPFVVNGFSEKAYQNALAGKSIQWIGAKNIPLEYIFIEDAGKCIATAGLSEQGINQEFNVPATAPITNSNYLGLISKVGGANSKLQILNSNLIFSIMGFFNKLIKEVAEMLYLKREELILDGSKFKNTFGFLPNTSYEEGVKKTFEWVKSFYKV
ncbi:MAG: SDR family NAD(P)-dependent oxidoreductase [Ignavibacteria bacterium]|nr:SDR family NAD(P)-dependent oxidoreductase [Ignavibacteria bacterium]